MERIHLLYFLSGGVLGGMGVLMMVEFIRLCAFHRHVPFPRNPDKSVVCSRCGSVLVGNPPLKDTPVLCEHCLELVR